MKTDLKRGEPGTEQILRHGHPAVHTSSFEGSETSENFSNSNNDRLELYHNDLQPVTYGNFHPVTIPHNDLYPVTYGNLHPVTIPHNDLYPVTYGNFHPVTIPHNDLYPVTYGNLHLVTIPITHNTTSIRSRMATSIRSTIPITSIQLSSSHVISIRLQASIRLHKAMQN
ncbi:hypothetical protein EVAR_11239_1 [Eumeta japonica]|uniref:Uncharacterized protein n=1 Tax=Eumeta variegata TaxID=151549 RepID=A0A4C1UM05_EUMVA|nr:hypothetical protein EVAR_11239_1 [Eumeta japonica]